MSAPEYIVKQKWLLKEYLLLVAGVAAAIIILLASGYYLGNQHSLNLIRENDDLLQTLSEQSIQLSALQRQVVMQEQVNKVELQANREAGQSLQDNIEKIRQLEREVVFYRSILAPGDSPTGLRVSQFQRQRQADGSFNWQVSLIQAGSDGRVVSGIAKIVLVVDNGGREETIPLTNKVGSQDFGFKFRYFQHIAGSTELSADKKPIAIEVTATKYGPSQTPVTRRFPWEPDEINNNVE